jgi:SAM-dependent methyltransferase
LVAPKAVVNRLLGRDEPILSYDRDLMQVDPMSERAVRAVVESPSLPAKFNPYQPGRSSYIIPKPRCSRGSLQGILPLPPLELTFCFQRTMDAFLSSGESDVSHMRRILEAAGSSFEASGRILDFGCGAARMMRWLDVDPDMCDVWGVDINAENIVWCQQNLSPPFNFATTTTFPHLPFEDGYFGFIYAGSVFSHISDLADTWLLELRRILAPGGRLYITVHDTHTVDVIMGFRPDHHLYWFTRLLNAFEKQSGFRSSKYGMFTITRTPHGAQVFYDHDFIRHHWGRHLQILSITPQVYLDIQSAVLMRKP